jgi:hypothetical protein
MLLSPTVEGFRLGSRHAMAERLMAAAQEAEPVAFVVAEFRGGTWLLGDDWATWFETLDEARSFAAATPSPPYWVGVFAVVPVDGGQLFPPAVREDHCPV